MIYHCEVYDDHQVNGWVPRTSSTIHSHQAVDGSWGLYYPRQVIIWDGGSFSTHWESPINQSRGAGDCAFQGESHDIPMKSTSNSHVYISLQGKSSCHHCLTVWPLLVLEKSMIYIYMIPSSLNYCQIYVV